ncbi:hypothetical protein Tsubulata_024217 [Turnera subulata]|uniref:Glycosyltransferase n=1 Tax=Turnera subulata TaxID=218843 RepID=A0A9Q0G740_9ROSI|nr:hypothetical protein Tsubulata_024217 [Turnera subulata]
MKKAELVFIPLPFMGHVVSAVELAKLLIHRDHRLSVTVLFMNPILDPRATKYVDSLTASSNPITGMRFLHLPSVDLKANELPHFSLIQGHKPHVKETVSKLLFSSNESTPDPPPLLAGFVIDMFLAGMMDVANEFGVPSYLFSPSSAAYLGLTIYLQALHEEQGVELSTEFKDSDAELPIPTLANPLPARLLPSLVLDKNFLPLFHDSALRLGEAKGVIVNTFAELESHAVNSLLSDDKIPPIYPVGPILDLKESGNGNKLEKGEEDVMKWLDEQATSSVVFLCFGSWGSLDDDQVREIAHALEHSEHPFLWSLRQPPPKGEVAAPSEYVNLHERLPEGFLDRTGETGRVIGWAPQVDILAHPAIGGFVSHCGWNSTLESVWFGVPIAAWPMYAEQQFNAFQVVMESGLATEIKMDHRRNFNGENESDGVGAEQIEKGIRRVMEGGEVRRKMKEMSDKARKAMMKGGSSYSSLGCLIEDIVEGSI